MRTLFRNQFILWNLLALLLIKVVFSYSPYQFANLTDAVGGFSKEDIIVQTNTLRLELGLKKLTENFSLDLAASQKLQDMTQEQYFAHISPSGITPWHWFETNKYNFSYAGENLAIGFWGASDTVNAWANSPSHRANLLNSNFQDIGVAVAPATIQGSRGILVVQLFGTSRFAKSKPFVQISSKFQPPKTTPVQNLKPTIVNSVPADQLSSLGEILNGAFAVYALAMFLTAVLFIIFAGIKKSTMIKAALGMALLALALVIPVIHTAHVAMIV